MPVEDWHVVTAFGWYALVTAGDGNT